MKVLITLIFLQPVEGERGWIEDGTNIWVNSPYNYNVGIGTSNPSYKLHVEGTGFMRGFVMPTGAQNGYVLVSDDQGNGSWQNPVYTTFKICKKTQDQSTSSTTLSDVNELFFNVSAGNYYFYEFYLVARSTSATVGIGIAISYPAALISSYTVKIPEGNDGTNALLVGWGTSSDDIVESGSFPSANTDYLIHVYGIIVPSQDGVLQLRFNSEANGTAVTIRQGSFGRMISY
ncbi:MAG: hypothetical protein ABIN15_00490 [candidate division WOR-3 bacterium]